MADPTKPSKRREYFHKRNLKKNYDLTPEQFKERLQKQEGRCAICGIRPIFQKLHVDHCHETGKIRGLLCSKCNVALGMFRDDPEVLHSAMQYILDSL